MAECGRPTKTLDMLSHKVAEPGKSCQGVLALRAATEVSLTMTLASKSGHVTSTNLLKCTLKQRQNLAELNPGRARSP